MMLRLVTILIIVIFVGLLSGGVFGMFSASPWGTAIICAGVLAVWVLLWLGCKAVDREVPRPPKTARGSHDRLYEIREQVQRQKERV